MSNKILDWVKGNWIILLGAALLLAGGIGLGTAFWDYSESENRTDALKEQFVQYHGDVDVQGIIDDSGIRPWFDLLTVDMVALQEQYPHVVGWLFFENEDINYPLIYSGDNETYLRRTYDGKSATAGSIFIDGVNNPDLTDTHTIIYGHNMKNLSMFGKLKFYKEQKDYYDGHKYFQIHTTEEVLRYEIFAYHDSYIGSYLFQEVHEDATNLVAQIKRDSLIGVTVDINDADKLITLSTCTADDEYRFVVHAVLTDRYPKYTLENNTEE